MSDNDPFQHCVLCGKLFTFHQCTLLYCENCYPKYCSAVAALNGVSYGVMDRDLKALDAKNKQRFQGHIERGGSYGRIE